MNFDTILSCSVLFYSFLFYLVLFCSILFRSVLFYSILFYLVLYCSILFYLVLFYSVLFYSILFYLVLFCSILFYLVLSSLSLADVLKMGSVMALRTTLAYFLSKEIKVRTLVDERCVLLLPLTPKIIEKREWRFVMKNMRW